jgi:predicted nuclease with TOPRIM domain
MKDNKKLNIFKVAFNRNQKEMIGRELLNKYYFSFTSMVEKLQKIKIPIYRDISRMARRISLNISTGR